MERFDRYLIALVLAHFIVTLVHATAHFALEIVPAGIDLVFIIGVPLHPDFPRRRQRRCGILAEPVLIDHRHDTVATRFQSEILCHELHGFSQ